MEHKINDGGPAFPLDPRRKDSWSPGMSLRDWFAGQALTGLALRAESNICTLKEIACMAYDLADAMLYFRGAATKGGA